MPMISGTGRSRISAARRLANVITPSRDTLTIPEGLASAMPAKRSRSFLRSLSAVIRSVTSSMCRITPAMEPDDSSLMG